MSDQTIIVFGNEKGGTGKSTAAMQVTAGLLRQGHAVAALDLDLRQGSLTRYLENRGLKNGLPMPAHAGIAPSALNHPRWSAEADQDALARALARFDGADFIIIDTPGSNTDLSQMAHACADILVTPINDSFLDLDVLARLDPKSRAFVGRSAYASLVQDLNEARAEVGRRPVDWIVMRNRLGHAEARNKQDMAEALSRLSTELGFRMVKGFGERVIFRELFHSGLTLFDLGAAVGGPNLSMSHIAARHEARALIDAILAGVRSEPLQEKAAVAA